jgi:hypothetical protein
VAPLAPTLAAVVIPIVSAVAVTPKVVRLPAVETESVVVNEDELFAVSRAAVDAANVSAVAVTANVPRLPAVVTDNAVANDEDPFAVNLPEVVAENVVANADAAFAVTLAAVVAANVSAVADTAKVDRLPAVVTVSVNVAVDEAFAVRRAAVVTPKVSVVAVTAKVVREPAVEMPSATVMVVSPSHVAGRGPSSTVLRRDGTQTVARFAAGPPGTVGLITKLGNYSLHLHVTFTTVAVAEPIAVHHSRMLFVRSFGGITSSPPGSHVQMIPLPPEDAMAA